MPHMTRIPADLARFGLVVETVPGWETRGSASFAPGCVVDHWTAGPRGTTKRPSLGVVVNGRPGLPGPLCNVYLARDGVCVVVAAGRANHAGTGSWKGLVGNSAAYGIEAEAADGADWTAAQRLAYPRLVAALLFGIGRDASWTCGHSEWAGPRKVDINGWPMSAMRSSVAAILASPTAPTTPIAPEDDMYGPDERNEVITRLDLANTNIGQLLNQMMDPAIGVLPQLARVATQLATQSDDVDEQELARQIIAGLAPQVAAAVGQAGGLTDERIRQITSEVVRGVFADAAA